MVSPSRAAPGREPSLDPGDCQVFLLCGGLGTRLRSVTAIPKAILPLRGVPFVGYTLRLLRLQGFRRLHLCLGFGAEEVLDGVRDLWGDDELTVTREDAPLGTGGALGQARGHARAFNLVLNADSYLEVYFPLLLGAVPGGPTPPGATMFAVWEDDRRDYGGLELDREGRVTGFLEKGASGPGWINAGVYWMEKGLLDRIPDGASSLERDLLAPLAREGGLRAVRTRAFFRDVGTPERLRLAKREFLMLERRCQVPGFGVGRSASPQAATQ